MSFANQTFRFTPVKAATTHKVYNITTPGTANTEFSQSLTDGTKQIMIRLREKDADIKFTFVSGESGTDYITIRKNTVYDRTNLDLTSATLYMQVTGASKTVEIEEWS